MKEDKHKKESVFGPNGRMPPLGQALPLVFQHTVAMIVGCVTPTIIIAGVAGLSGGDKVIIAQAALVVSALVTLLQIFLVGFRRGSLQFGVGLPPIVGVGLTYAISMSTIVEGYGTATVFRAETVGEIVAVLVGLSCNKIKSLFPPLTIGIVILYIGLSLYPIAIRYMAERQGSGSYGSWQNWLVAALTLTVVIACNNCDKGIIKLVSVLIGVIIRCGVALGFGMVDFSAVGRVDVFALPEMMHFRIGLEVSSRVVIGPLFAINSLQATRDMTVTTMGGTDRGATNKESWGGILGSGLSNITEVLLEELPNVTFNQNMGIATTAKVMSRWIAALAAIILGIVGIPPESSAPLTSIPQHVLGGATLTVFAVITVTGTRMMFSTGLSMRSGFIVDTAVALGVGATQASNALCGFPSWMTVVFVKTPVVVVTVVSILLSLLLSRDKEER